VIGEREKFFTGEVGPQGAGKDTNGILEMLEMFSNKEFWDL
jgi:hypothetical protein